jgi:signal transduction histidine kinase
LPPGSKGYWSDGRELFVEPAPHGGTYIVAWNPNQDMDRVHEKLHWLLLSLMAGVVLVAYLTQRRLLRPVRALGEGVERLSAGDLDITLPVVTNDEFGVLTHGFNRMVRRVREMVQARDQLLLDVSHELRSPLTRLKVALEFLPEGENRAQMASDVVEMELMIAELLELERLREGRGIRTERQDLLPILREVAASFCDRHPGVRVDTIEREIVLDFDADKLRTVLRNILENACKYSLPDSRAVEISTAQNSEAVMVRITDDGPGIPEADVQSIFDPFFRVDRSRSRQTGGYGLGLSICKRIMEAHGGSIAVESNPGRGASFVLRLPKAAGEAR